MFKVQVQTMDGRWQDSYRVTEQFTDESTARIAAEQAFPDRFPEGTPEATFRIVPVSKLTDEQKVAAGELLKSRPTVLPGTRAIVSKIEANKWHGTVSAKMLTLKVLRPDEVTEFCDLAGVAD